MAKDRRPAIIAGVIEYFEWPTRLLRVGRCLEAGMVKDRVLVQRFPK